MKAEQPRPLEYADTEAMIDELSRRFKAMLIVTDQDVKNEPTFAHPTVAYYGGWASALGLACHAEDYIRYALPEEE